jgi:ribonucleotide reductase alpha subunit
MKFIDSLGRFVGQQGRIPAMLFSLSCSHPDVIDFVKVKADRTVIQNANISVQCTDAFYDAVDADADWELSFHIPEVKKGQKVYVDVHSTDMSCKYDEKKRKWYYTARKPRAAESVSKTVKARDLMELIAKYMLANGEPGVQNIDIARYWSNSDYVYDPKDEYDSRIIGTNACCLAADTKIMTNHGWFTIKEIYNLVNSGDKTLFAMSYNLETKSFEMKAITNAWQQRNDTTVELVVEENGKTYKVECSSDHKIMTRNRGYVPAASLTENDDIMIFS